MFKRDPTIDAPSEKVSKMEVARRQLRVAIRLFFGREDLIAVHTLATASQDVLKDIGSTRGVQSMMKGSDSMCVDLIKDEFRDDWHQLMRESQNFFKHADRDPDVVHDFYFGVTPFYIMDAAQMYNMLDPNGCPEVTFFLSWFTIKYSDLLLDGPMKDLVSTALAEGIDPDDFELVEMAMQSLCEKKDE